VTLLPLDGLVTSPSLLPERATSRRFGLGLPALASFGRSPTHPRSGESPRQPGAVITCASMETTSCRSENRTRPGSPSGRSLVYHRHEYYYHDHSGHVHEYCYT